MTNNLSIYLLDPQEYSPETIAVTFAKTSRSPESFQQIAVELNEAKSAEFNEKWVVGYGHSSVAEHAVLHIAVENISRLATECLESNRLASYTEKSTRYQTWNEDAFFTPEEFKGSSLLGEYLDTCRSLLACYHKAIPLVNEALHRDIPKVEPGSDQAMERRIRAMTTDVCRFLLPAAVLANVGMTINARALEHAITKMLSHPLKEVQKVGMGIKNCASMEVPTLLKYAEEDNYLQEAASLFQITGMPAKNTTDWCRLVQFTPDAEANLLAATLYRYGNYDYAQFLEWVKTAPIEETTRLVKSLLSSEIPHFTPLRELEHAIFTFDITIDQGAYYEVKRHRMMTLTAQPLDTGSGYAIPLMIEKAGMLDEYIACMQKAGRTFAALAGLNRDAAAYIAPNAYNRRFLMTSNLRSLLHFIKLRAAPNAHFSVRRLAQRMAAELRQALPVFAPFLDICPQEDVNVIESGFFHETRKR